MEDAQLVALSGAEVQRPLLSEVISDPDIGASANAGAKACVEDVVIDDYFIPKGTVVYPNIWAVNHDPKYWKDPAKFDPGRYLNEDGSIIAPKPEYLVTFSVGRRACPGEMFATVEIFLAITHLLQKYRILLEKPLEYDLDSLETQLLRINGIKLRFLPRQAEDSSKTN
ncbi:hypothetical protein HPB49_009382 [Dermacentor silvarum]|uniref:Uncharacterized protein n=1 Tax=Dermacentor silvarum TaxID=543639 RepID=A0ACB8CEC3_DERSI|nr:hypothetical protein HPB49_009382 [Dermacentor silvarum]